MKNYEIITPKSVQGIINKFCCTIGMIPTSYKLSLSYEEQILAIGKYLEEVVYPAINNNANALAELQQLFIDLKNYVDNYFDDLDVQDEIDNKLDEMAQSGELAEIIAQYLNSQAVIGFNSVNDMVNSENLSDGSIVKTLGFHSYNDGGGAFYKIREITNLDDVNDIDLFALENSITLVAELIKTKEINIKQLGGKGNGIDDDFSIIQYALDSTPNGTIYFPNGTYLISESIITSANYQKTVSLKLEKNAIIKASESFEENEYMLKIGGKDTETQSLYNNGVRSMLQGGIFDCNNIASGISVYGISPTIKDIEIRNCGLIGIDVPYGMHSGSADCLISNVVIMGTNVNESIGLNVDAMDNIFENIRTSKTEIGVKVTGNGNYFTNIHPLQSNDDTTRYNNTIGFLVDSWNSTFTNCYSDNFSTGFLNKNSKRNYYNNLTCFWWSGGNFNQKAFVEENALTSIIEGLFVEFHDTNGTHSIIEGVSVNGGHFRNISKGANTNVLSANDKSKNPQFNYDRMILDTNNLTLNNATINQNHTIAENGVVMISCNITGLAMTHGSATTVFRLQEGWRPKTNAVNVLAINNGNNNFNHIIGWINVDGYLNINPATIDIASVEQVFINTSYNI